MPLVCLGCSSVILLQLSTKLGIAVWPAIYCRPLAPLEYGLDILPSQCPMSLQGMRERENLAAILLQQRLHAVQHVPQLVLDPIGQSSLHHRLWVLGLLSAATPGSANFKFLGGGV
jgi:hypothetical protein